jgi:acyl-CoA synthetase (AMP-forming)/AMP-acid ligase II
MLLQHLLRDGAHRTPDKVALHWVDRDRSMTYAEAAATMETVAGALASLGVGRGDRVGIFAHNGMDYLTALFGTWRLGAISALVNLQYADTFDYFINDAQPKVVIYTGDHLATVERHRAKLASVEHFVCMDGPQDGAVGWEELLASAAPAPPDASEEGDIAHLSYTSGTSGNPKGACLAHEPTCRATRCIAERLRMTAADVSLGPTALSSSYQLVANLLPALHVGGTVCVMSKWDTVAGWDAAERLGVTVLAANPTVLRDLLDESTRRGRSPSSLRAAVSGGAPVPPELKQAFRDTLGLPLCESYGQSELGGFVGLWASDEMVTDERLLSCGRPLPDKQVYVLDDDGHVVPVGELGELCVRGGFMTGYWNSPDKTAAALEGGWLHTGDVGFMDAAGYVFMRGRLSERLTIDGTHWYPRDVEEVLMRHPGVREAALVGFPDSSSGQRAVAYVTTRLADPPEAQRLVEFAAERLGRSVPSMTVQFIDAMPMTPTGKISKAQLLALDGVA